MKRFALIRANGGEVGTHDNIQSIEAAIEFMYDQETNPSFTIFDTKTMKAYYIHPIIRVDANLPEELSNA